MSDIDYGAVPHPLTQCEYKAKLDAIFILIREVYNGQIFVSILYISFDISYFQDEAS